MSIFCPFFKDTCKGNECVMWKEEKCLIISFMEHLITHPEGDFGEREPIGREIRRIRETEIPDAIKSATPEELAAQLVSFAKNECRDEEEIDLYMVSEAFWDAKGVSIWNVPPAIKLKMEKAERIAEKLLDDERDLMEKVQLKKEESGLPSLVNLCVDWARGHGLRTVTKSDIKAFLAERNVEILPQTLSLLHAQVNVKLKSKH